MQIECEAAKAAYKEDKQLHTMASALELIKNC
jgi:hypothetical protein